MGIDCDMNADMLHTDTAFWLYIYSLNTYDQKKKKQLIAEKYANIQSRTFSLARFTMQ